MMRRALAQAKKRQDEQDHDNEANEVDNAVHEALPTAARKAHLLEQVSR